VVANGPVTMTGAFRNARNLEKITLGDAVRTIDDAITVDPGMFEGLEKLKEVVWTAGADFKIGNKAFRNCAVLDTIPSLAAITTTGTGKIGDYAFEKTKLLRSVILPSADYTTLAAGAFKDSGLRSVDLGTTAIAVITGGSDGAGAFQGCTSLETVTIRDAAIEIQSYAFAGCTSLKTVASIPVVNGVSVNKAAIPAEIITIANDAFKGCTSLTELDLTLATGTTYGAGAFNGCTNIEKVTVGGETPTAASPTTTDLGIPSMRFLVWDIDEMTNRIVLTNAAKLEKLTFRTQIETAGGKVAASWPTNAPNFKTLEIKDNNQNGGVSELFVDIPDSVDSVIIGVKPGNPPTGLTVGHADTNALFNSKVKNIKFEGAIGVVAWNFFEGLQDVALSINDDPGTAFSDIVPSTDAVKTVNFGKNVPVVGYNWLGSTNLVNYTVASDNTRLGTNGNDGVLYGKNVGTGVLETLIHYPPKKVDKEYAIVSGVINIGGLSFVNNTLVTKVVIPASVRTFGSMVFSGCSGITDIEYNATFLSADTAGTEMFPASTLRVVIGEGVRDIPGKFLVAGNQVKQITIPESVQRIATGGTPSFATATPLETVIFKAVSLSSDSAFSGVSTIRNLTLGDKVTRINKSTFAGTGLLAPLDLNKVTFIDDNAFDGTAINELLIPASVNHIGASAFANCASLDMVKFAPLATGRVTFVTSSFPAGTTNALKAVYDLADDDTTTPGGPGGAGIYRKGASFGWEKRAN
jgi:hypothetical protein